MGDRKSDMIDVKADLLHLKEIIKGQGTLIAKLYTMCTANHDELIKLREKVRNMPDELTDFARDMVKAAESDSEEARNPVTKTEEIRDGNGNVVSLLPYGLPHPNPYGAVPTRESARRLLDEIHGAVSSESATMHRYGEDIVEGIAQGVEASKRRFADGED